MPTMDKIYSEALNTPGFPPMSRATFHKWVIKLGFVCKKSNMKLKVYQRMDVVVQRQIYLRNLRDLKDLLDIKFSIRIILKWLKTYWETLSWFEKFVLKSRKYQNIFLRTRKINPLRKISLFLLQENWPELRKYLKTRLIFFIIKKTFLSKEIFLISGKLFLFWDHFLKLR